MNIIKRLFDHEYKEMERFKKLRDKILALDEEYSKLNKLETTQNKNTTKYTKKELKRAKLKQLHNQKAKSKANKTKRK